MTHLLLLISLVVALLPLVASQADGNPHHWDRLRRCDQLDYDPPCGPCEGIGGKAYGDDNSQIDLTTCEVVANASHIDPSTLIHPVWGSQFTIDNYFEILIGKKNDPFCFQAFPSNDSVGELCYRPQQGKQYYDMVNHRALRYDVEIATALGNLTSTVIHQGALMWIVNVFPWYAFGTHQCICTRVTQGGDKAQPNVYPIQSNWTDNLVFIGREKLLIEYIYETQIVDHWAFGPHHVWTHPNTGQLIRMWQPFNGLEVFPNGTNPSFVDPTMFSEIPPDLCKKGGALFRIGCDDEGYPSNTSTLKSSSRDVRRAQTMMPRHDYRGQTFGEMSSVLNRWLNQTTLAQTKHCSEWQVTELQQLQAMLYLLRDTSLDDIYQQAEDNRQLQGELDDLMLKWSNLNDIASDSSLPVMTNLQRDGHCHEAVMWYVHHLSTDVKDMLSQSNIQIPLLSYHRHTCPDGASSEETKVCDMYESQVTCASCHSDV